MGASRWLDANTPVGTAVTSAIVTRIFSLSCLIQTSFPRVTYVTSFRARHERCCAPRRCSVHYECVYEWKYGTTPGSGFSRGLNFSGNVVSTLASYSTIDWTEDERSWCALVRQIAKGNEDALTDLYDSTNRMVYGLALRILGNSSSAEEVLLDVYVQVWRTARNFDPGRGKVTSWLVSIARSRAIDALRSRQARGGNLATPLEDVSDLQDLRGGPEGNSILRSRAQVV